jgi:hypothetical protein
MRKLHFSVMINASKEKVWNLMLGEDSYREWSAAFMPGSHYVGDWNEGSKILFLAPGESGETGGMVSRVKENRPYEFISIEHLGFVQGGKEDTSSPAIQGWSGALENYTFKEANGRTEVVVDLDSVDEEAEMFLDLWPKALQNLKKLAEKQDGY